MSFSDYKKKSKLGSLTEKLVQKLNKMEDGYKDTDDRIWKPTMTKAGVGEALIRFLPGGGGNDDYSITDEIYSHAFKGPSGQWYIEKCLTTIGKPCPVW
jgi:hypothetical protein